MLYEKTRQGTREKQRPHILFIDIETAPLLAYVWGLWNQNVGLNQIHTEWRLLSFAAKFRGSSEVLYHDARHSIDNDNAILAHLWMLLDMADIVVAHNAVRFDVRKINARFAMMGLGPPAPYQVIDTMRVAKKHFGFTSNRLEWLASKLCTRHRKSAHAKFAGFELWKQCLAGNAEAWDEMRKYNIADVHALEELYVRLRPWMQGHPNVGNYVEAGTRPRCPHCGSTRVIRRGLRHTQAGQYPRYVCKSCGAWSRARTSTSTPEHRKTLLVS